MTGFFSVHRSIWESDHFSKEPFTEREAFMWMVSEAAWKATKTRIQGRRIELQRGQFSHAIRYMAEAWGWHRSRVDRFLRRLKTETVIETKRETKFVIVTVCNYDIYQKSPKVGETKFETLYETVARQLRDREEELKELKEGNNPPIVPPGDKPKRNRGFRLSDHLKANGSMPECPEEYRAAAEALGVEASDQWPRFYDYWLAQPGQKGVKLDWLATWRNWCRKSVDDGRNGRGPPRHQPRSKVAEILDARRSELWND